MNRNIRKFISIAFALLLFIPTFAQLPEKIMAAAAECGFKVSGIEALEIGERLEDLYSDKYKLFIEQPIDHTNPSLGTFKQKVILFHVDYANPMLLITEGYTSNGAHPRYSNELSTLFEPTS